jgi:hypothetical protein
MAFCAIRGPLLFAEHLFAEHRARGAVVDGSNFPFQRFANLAASNEGDTAAGIDWSPPLRA